MKCPACQKVMTEQDFGGVKVDVCKDGCKGIWFDWLELRKLDEKNEGLGNALKEALNYPRVNDENRSRIKCPKCNIPMHTHKYESSKEVNVDECYKCAGFFLDSGELKVIRDAFMSEEECEAYTSKLLAGIPEWQEAQKDLDKQKARADAIRRYTRFLRISYYLKGK
ncbi:MAG: zf-TFIIB domain-containing protein [Candidatus Omnitrophota bacterium]|nr:MAG: zf-TFIIB domain-containing protein [Candidatus Omnitrophota bacterium]